MPEYVDRYHHSTTDSTSTRLTCPYCGYEYERDFYLGEDEVNEMECAQCEKRYAVTIVITHRYICMPEVANG